MSNIHPTAMIAETAKIHESTEIGPYCTIGPYVEIGAHNHLRSHIVMEGHTTLGDENTIYPFATFGLEPQDLKFKNETTYLEIGNHNIFREGVSIHRGTVTGTGITKIGSHNLIMGYVHVAHDCEIGNYNILANYTGLSGHVLIQDYVNLGGQTGVTQFVHIGSYAFLGGASLVDKHVAPYCSGYGNRLEIKGINIIGLKRRGFSREVINTILEIHNIFYRSEMNEKDAIKVIEEAYGAIPEARVFINFVNECAGGVKR